MTGTPTTRGTRRDAAILRGAVTSVAVRLVNAAAAVITLGVAASALSGEEFGLVAALFSLWMVLALFDLGVGGALVTRVAAAQGRGDDSEMRMYVYEALLALTVIGLLISAVGTAGAVLLPWETWIGGDTLGTATVRVSVTLVFLLAGLALPAAIGIMTLTGQQRLASAQVAMAGRGLATLIATVVAAYAGLGPWAFILAFVGAPTLMSGSVTAWILVRKLGRVRVRAILSTRRVTQTIRDSGLFAVCNMGNAVAFATGTFIVAAVLGPGEAAVFGVASRMFALVGTMVVGAGAQLWPAMTEAITRGDVQWARSRYRRGLVVVGGLTSAVCVGLVVLGQPLARIWVGSALVPSLDLLVWTAAFTIAVTVALQASVLLRALDKLRMLAALCVTTAVVSVVISILLTEMMGMSGAAVGPLAVCLGLFLPGVALLSHRALRGLDQH